MRMSEKTTVTIVGMNEVRTEEVEGFTLEEREFHMDFTNKDYAGRALCDSPSEGLCGPMANGNDIVINGKTYLLLDRFETWESYERLAR